MPSYQSVDVYVMKRGTNEPMEDVVVRVFNEENTVFYADSVTDAEGRVGFTLYTRKYNLRFYKFSTRFQQPQLIEVLEGPSGEAVENSFNVYAEVVDCDSAIDPKLCRASGYFRDITGAPHRYLDIIFIGEFAPILLDGSGVLSERRMIRTDKSGLACVDLIRCAKYSVTVEGFEDQLRSISVPDAPSVNLPDLLFPTADSVSFDPPSPWTLSVGSTLVLTPSVRTSSKVLLEGTANADVRYEVEDPTIASVEIVDKTTIQITALTRGSTQLLVKRKDLSIVKIPFTEELTGSGQPIVVS
jgi:hypothetical protein